MKENTFLILDGTALLHKHYYATIPKALYRKKDMKMQIQHTSYGTYTPRCPRYGLRLLSRS